jgi:formate hydrogenlyase subunit 6/NADH:ubiquinone oxidoreductase subunit I
MKKVLFYRDFVLKLKDILSEVGNNGYLYLPNSNNTYSRFTFNDEIVVDEKSLNKIRTIDPVKTFFFKPREPILNFEKENFLQIIVGIKSCDISALKILDKIFLNKEYIDPLYQFYRERTIIVSTDCPYPEKNCFCNLVGGNPYCDSGYDLNLSLVEDGRYILSSGSKKGEEIIEKHFSNFSQPYKDDIIKNDNLRILAKQVLKENNKDYYIDVEEYYNIIKDGYELNDIWKKESEQCVQCSGCNFICPSCYCFLIRESSKSFQEQFRDKVWDACHSTGYARVAGGGNARKYKFQRFRNRYQCKFVYRKDNYNIYACTGCGRCIDVCPAKIDIRKVTKNFSIAKLV